MTQIHLPVTVQLNAPASFDEGTQSDAPYGWRVSAGQEKALEDHPIEAGWSSRLIIRTMTNADRSGFAEIILNAYEDIFKRAFGTKLEAGEMAILRLLSEPFQEGMLWVAVLDGEVVGAMMVSTHRTPVVDIFKLLGIFGGHLGLLQGLWGTMTLNPFLSKPSEQGLYLNFLAVHPNFQGHKIGRAILQRAIELTMYEGLPQTMTWLPAGHDRIIRLHKDFGFSIRRTYRSTLLKQLVGEGEWHYLTRPAAIRLTAMQPAVEPIGS